MISRRPRAARLIPSMQGLPCARGGQFGWPASCSNVLADGESERTNRATLYRFDAEGHAMSTTVEVCVVVMTIAVVLLAYVAARVMFKLETTTKKFEDRFAHLEQILEDSRQTSSRIRELVNVLEEIAHSVRSGVERIEGVVEQASSVSATVLDEIERPVRSVVAVMRGLRLGVRALTERWTNGREPMVHAKGGENHV